MDQIAREYLVLSLALGELEDGVVDSYFGPVEVRAEAAARNATPLELAADAAALRRRVDDETPDDQRRRWLDRQLVAIETLARRVGGEEFDYVEEVERCFDAKPEATPREEYARVRTRLEELLPAGPSLRERLDVRDERLTIPVDRLESTLHWLIAELRQDCVGWLPIPEGESLEVSLVTNEPWSAYNWYDGELRSRIEFNTDLPTRAYSLIDTLAHETFPGHHLEHGWKEQRLARERALGEATVLLINTPEAYISEGLAEAGSRLMLSPERWQELLVGACGRAGIPLTVADAEREWAVTQALRPLRGTSGDAALMYHAERRSLDEVRRFLIEDGLASPQRADKNVQFIGHPLWRTYVFCYAGGERLLGAWCAAAGDATAQRDRFFRLLTEQLTPSGIAEELASGISAA